MAGFEVTPYGRFCLTPEGKFTFADPEKIRELARRGEAWGIQRAGRCLSTRLRTVEVGFT